MTPSAHAVSRALRRAMDGHAINRREHRAIFNPDPEVNSLAEHIIALRGHGVPVSVIREILGLVREILHLNDAEDGCHTALAGQLDELTTRLRNAELNDPAHQALGVKAIARALRKPLADLDTTDGITYFQASAALRDVMATATPDQLRATSLRHELGAGPHDRLLAFLKAVPA